MGAILTEVDTAETSTAEPDALAAAPPWEEIVPLVHRQMRSLLGPAHPDLEDLTQNALEQVLRSLSRFEGRSLFSTFTYRICAHVVMNHFRGFRRWLKRFQLDAIAADEPASPEPDVSDVLVSRERAKRLHLALDRMAPIKRIVLVLCDLEDLPASEVATIVGCPEPTVRSRLRLARMELAERLGRDPLFATNAPRKESRS
jgi:RNA polymerase sigma-70 factor (ECF subfamily)